MKLGQPMPSMSGKWLYTRYDRKGADVICVLFWSVSCTQCAEVLTVMRDIQTSYEQVRVLAVHMPRRAEDRDVQQIKSKYELSKLQAPLYIDDELLLTKRFSNRLVPSVYLFNRDGLRFVQAGTLSRRFLMHRIEKILKI